MSVPDITAGVAAILALPLVTVDETAQVLRCSPRTVYRLIDAGKLKPVKIGSLVRLKSADIQAIVDGEAR